MRRAFLNVLPFGPTVELQQRALIGRGLRCDVKVEVASREHCAIVRVGDGFSISDLGSGQGTWVQHGDGAAAKVRSVPLFHGDQIVFPGAIVRFTVDAPYARKSEPVLAALEQKISAQPDDEGSWRVYADALLEHGHRADAERIIHSQFHWDRSDVWLRTMTEAQLSVRWRFGHAAEVAFRSTPARREEAPIARALTELLKTRAARFLQSLHFDLSPDRVDVMTDVFEALAGATHSTLRTVSFGPFFTGQPVSVAVQRPMRGPYLGPYETQMFGDAWLEEGSGRIPLNRDQPLAWGPLTLSFIRRRWRLLGGSVDLKLNGIRHAWEGFEHLLAPGDLIEVGPRKARFSAETRATHG